jgi:hypothetical protein
LLPPQLRADGHGTSGVESTTLTSIYLTFKIEPKLFKFGINNIPPIQPNTNGNFISVFHNGGKLEATIYALGRFNMFLCPDHTVGIVNDKATNYDWNRGGDFFRRMLIDKERPSEGLSDSNGFKIFGSLKL